MPEGDRTLESLRRAIDAFGAERAPELVAEARAEAVAKARSMLAEAMAQSLLDHAGEHLVGGSGAPTRRARQRSQPPRARTERASERGGVVRESTTRPHTGAASAYYVYGITWADGPGLPDGTPGVDPRNPAELLAHEELAAIVSRVSLDEFGEEELHDNLNDVRWLEEKARAHEGVLHTTLSQASVVPLRLCTIYRGAEQVEEMLRAERKVFGDALRRLEGKTEWGVKLIAEPGAIERAAAVQGEQAEDDDASASAGVAYMNRKRREADLRDASDAVAEAWADDVHGRLAARASEALLNPVQNPEVSGHEGDMLLNGVYLVDDRESDEFRRAVDELAAEYRDRGASVELTGPWPAYNFVKSSIEAAR